MYHMTDDRHLCDTKKCQGKNISAQNIGKIRKDR